MQQDQIAMADSTVVCSATCKTVSVYSGMFLPPASPHKYTLQCQGGQLKPMWFHFGSAVLFFLLKPPFKGYWDMKYHFRISSTQARWTIQPDSSLDSTSSPEKYKELQQLCGQKHSTTLCNWLKKMMHYIPMIMNPLICSNTGYSLITYSMIVYSPLCTTVSAAVVLHS